MTAVTTVPTAGFMENEDSPRRETAWEGGEYSHGETVPQLSLGQTQLLQIQHRLAQRQASLPSVSSTLLMRADVFNGVVIEKRQFVDTFPPGSICQLGFSGSSSWNLLQNGSFCWFSAPEDHKVCLQVCLL